MSNLNVNRLVSWLSPSRQRSPEATHSWADRSDDDQFNPAEASVPLSAPEQPEAPAPLRDLPESITAKAKGIKGTEPWLTTARAADRTATLEETQTAAGDVFYFAATHGLDADAALFLSDVTFLRDCDGDRLRQDFFKEVSLDPSYAQRRSVLQDALGWDYTRLLMTLALIDYIAMSRGDSLARQRHAKLRQQLRPEAVAFVDDVAPIFERALQEAHGPVSFRTLPDLLARAGASAPVEPERAPASAPVRQPIQVVPDDRFLVRPVEESPALSLEFERFWAESPRRPAVPIARPAAPIVEEPMREAQPMCEAEAITQAPDIQLAEEPLAFPEAQSPDSFPVAADLLFLELAQPAPELPPARQEPVTPVYRDIPTAVPQEPPTRVQEAAEDAKAVARAAEPLALFAEEAPIIPQSDDPLPLVDDALPDALSAVAFETVSDVPVLESAAADLVSAPEALLVEEAPQLVLEEEPLVVPQIEEALPRALDRDDSASLPFRRLMPGDLEIIEAMQAKVSVEPWSETSPLSMKARRIVDRYARRLRRRGLTETERDLFQFAVDTPLGQQLPIEWRLFTHGGYSYLRHAPRVTFGRPVVMSRFDEQARRMSHFPDRRNSYHILKYELGLVKDFMEQRPGINLHPAKQSLVHRDIYAMYRAHLYACDWDYAQAFRRTWHTSGLAEIGSSIGLNEASAPLKAYAILERLAIEVDGPLEDRAVRRANLRDLRTSS